MWEAECLGLSGTVSTVCTTVRLLENISQAGIDGDMLRSAGWQAELHLHYHLTLPAQLPRRELKISSSPARSSPQCPLIFFPLRQQGWHWTDLAQ